MIQFDKHCLQTAPCTMSHDTMRLIQLKISKKAWFSLVTPIKTIREPLSYLLTFYTKTTIIISLLKPTKGQPDGSPRHPSRLDSEVQSGVRLFAEKSAIPATTSL